ncbi:MAG TPA: hypothetical protein VIH58_12675 [Chthoniobacterales bacterium]|jgi:hypothetical protein
MRERRVGLLLRIPEGLKKRLVDLAKRERRSVNQQIEFMLEGSLTTAMKSLTIEQQIGKSGEKSNR